MARVISRWRCEVTAETPLRQHHGVGTSDEEIVETTDFDCLLMVEHRLDLQNLKRAALFADRLGYRLAATAATKAKVHNSGGALAMFKKHLSAWLRQHAPLLHERGT